MRQSLSKNSLLYSAASYFNITILLLVNIIVAQVLGPSGKGAISLITILSFFIVHFVNCGINRSNVYFIGKEKGKETAIIDNATVFSLVVGVLVGIIFWLMRGRIAFVLSLEEYIPALGIIAFSFPIVILKSNYWNVLLGLKRFGERNIAVILDHLVYLVVIILLVFAVKKGVSGATVAYVVRGIPPILLIVYFFHKAGFAVGLKPDMPLLKQSLDYGIKSQFGNVLQEFTYKLDMFIVNFYLGVSSVGIYSIAVSVGQLLWHFSDAVGNVLFPSVVDKDEAASNTMIASVCRKTLIVTVAGAILILWGSSYIVPFLFGKSFVPSVLPLIILLPGIVAISVHKVLIYGLLGRGYPHYMSYSGMISIVLTVILDILLIPKYGVEGAAVASTISYFACTFFTVFWFMEISGMSAREVLMPTLEDVTGIMKKMKNMIQEAVAKV